MTTASQISKELTKAGFNKAGFSRVNFENVPFGKFEVNQMKRFGMNLVIVTPKNGAKPEDFQIALSNYNTEVKSGYLIVK